MHASSEDDNVLAGGSLLDITAYGTAAVRTRNPTGTGVLYLHDVALCKDMASNLISYDKLLHAGYVWDHTNVPEMCLRNCAGENVGFIGRMYGLFVLEHNLTHQNLSYTPSSFFARKSSQPKATQWASAHRWHLRMGHPGSQAINHLCISVTGTKVRGIHTTECDACA